jgi:hypothetical protein
VETHVVAAGYNQQPNQPLDAVHNKVAACAHPSTYGERERDRETQREIERKRETGIVIGGLAQSLSLSWSSVCLVTQSHRFKLALFMTLCMGIPTDAHTYTHIRAHTRTHTDTHTSLYQCAPPPLS